MELMKVTNAELVSFNKRLRISGGVYIKYVSSENVSKGSLVKIEYNSLLMLNPDHYFEVTDVKIDGNLQSRFLPEQNNNLEVTAKEVGYWAKKFDKIEDFDLRRLIGLEVINVSDSETISKVREMSLWC